MAEDSYLEWCRQHKISMHGVQPAFVAEGWRGVVATQELSPDHVVMKVPQSMLMSVLTANQDAALATLLQQHQLSSHQVLAVHLIHEASKGPASKWHPYIQQLPRTYTTFANWPPAAVRQLQVDYAQAAATEAVCKARQEWTTARPVLQQLGVDKKWSSWHAWQWACSAVLSRTMYHPADPACGCLTPLGDLHNYAPPPPPHTPQLEQDLEQLLQQQQQEQQQQEEQKQEQQQELRWQQSSTLLLVEQQQDTLDQGSEQQLRQLQLANGASQGPEQQQLQQGTEGASQDTQEDTAQGVVPGAEAKSNCHGGDVVRAAAAAAAAAADAAADAADASSMLSGASQQLKLTNRQDSLAQPYAGHIASAVGVAAASQATSTQSQCCGNNTPAVPEDTQRADEARQGQQQQQQQQEQQPAGKVLLQQAEESVGAAAGSGAVDNAGSASMCGDGHFDEAEGCYKIFARRRYKPGDQVFLCYGHHTNLELLQLYGFLLPDNPHEASLIPLPLLQQHLQRAAHSYQQRQRVQQQQGCEGRRAQCRRQHKVQQEDQLYVDISEADCWVHGNGQPSWQLLSALRSAASCVTGYAAAAFKAQCGEPVSLASELLVLQALQGACREQLDNLPTSLTQDAQLQQANSTAAAASTQSDSGCAPDENLAASKAAAADAVVTVSEVGSTGSRCAASQQCIEQTHAQSKPAVSAGVMQQQEECYILALLWRHSYKSALRACVERCERLSAVVGTCGNLTL